MAKTASQIIRSASTSAWTTRANSSGKLMQITVDACRHAMGDSGDWTVLAHHLSKGIASGAKKEVDNLKLVIKAVLPGITMVKDADQPTGIRISLKAATLSNSGIDNVQTLIERKVALGGTAIKAALVEEKEKKEKSFDPKAKAKTVIKGLSSAQVDALIASIQVERKAM